MTPAYDALTDEQRDSWITEHARSFLAALPTSTSSITQGDLEKCRAAVERLVAAGCFRRLSSPFVAIYQLESGPHVQTALLCDLHVSAVDDSLIIGHERTRTAREDDLVAYLRTVQITSSPVCVMHSHHGSLAGRLERAASPAPDIELASPALTQRLWVVDEPPVVADLLEHAARVGPLVITDGHHRTAAARRFAAEAEHPAGRRILVAMFPEDGVQIREFNRVVRDVGMTGTDLVARLRGRGLQVTQLAGPEHPQRPHQMTMTADASWWRVVFPESVLPDDPVESLDVSLVQTQVLEPVLGISDARTDERLSFVAGTRGLDGLQAAAGDTGVGFALHPIDTQEIMRIAMSHRTLPPKSTYLEPKARSGLLLLPRH